MNVAEALRVLEVYFNHKTGSVPEAMAALEDAWRIHNGAVKERDAMHAELVAERERTDALVNALSYEGGPWPKRVGAAMQAVRDRDCRRRGELLAVWDYRDRRAETMKPLVMPFRMVPCATNEYEERWRELSRAVCVERGNHDWRSWRGAVRCSICGVRGTVLLDGDPRLATGDA